MNKLPKPIHKGKHTSPENAGVQNLKGAKLPSGGGLNDKIYPVMQHGKHIPYSGKWTDEEFADSVAEFFAYCTETDTKPTQPLLRLWLGVSRSQFYDWINKPSKYKGKSDILQSAMDYMEAYLQSNIDQYPTGSIFLLKSTHKHSDKQEITINNGKDVSKDEIKDVVGKLGLDKSE